jgi:hypothetical protein
MTLQINHSGSPVLGVRPDVVKLDSDEREEVGSGEVERSARGSEGSINTRSGSRCRRGNEASIVSSIELCGFQEEESPGSRGESLSMYEWRRKWDFDDGKPYCH